MGVWPGNRRKRVWLRVLVASFTVASILFAGLSGFVTYQRWMLSANIQKLQVGDSKERAEELLGKPRWQFSKGTQLLDQARKQDLVLWLLTPESPETWVYGPWQLQWVAPEEEDYVIEFDESGRVARVVFPRQ